MTDKERLAFIKRSLDKVKKLWENDEFVKGDEIYLSLVSEFEWVINYAKEQAKRVEQSENQLYECPVCGFEYHKRHEDVGGGYTCPTCSEADLMEQIKGYRDRIEELKSKIWELVRQRRNYLEALIEIYSEDGWETVDEARDIARKALEGEK